MQILSIAENFWNIRGSFRIGGVLNIGTQASLVQLASGRFVLLDSLRLDSTTRSRINRITEDGKLIDAILNLHPFHTVHVEAMHRTFPEARLYGTRRHHERFADLPWEPETTESPALHQLFAPELDFSVPRGVDFVSPNPNLHFSSVLVRHRASATLHVDDTLIYMRLPGPLQRLSQAGRLAFHPTLAQVLEKRPGAAAEFRAWAKALITDWADVRHLCAAHTHALTDPGSRQPMTRVAQALNRVESLLARHQRRYG